MSQAPKIEHVEYDETCPIMDREQIDMLLMEDDGETDTSLARELFALFETEGETKLKELTGVCAQGDLITLRNIVHFVAGSAGNLGLARMCAFYRGIERAIDEEKLTDISECEGPIRGEFDAGCEAFRADFKF